MKKIDTVLFLIAILWFLFILFYLPATNISSIGICDKIARGTNSGAAFLEECKALIPDLTRKDLIIFLLISCAWLVAISFRLHLVAKKRIQ